MPPNRPVFLEYLRSGHGVEHLIGVKGGAQEAKFRGGAHAISRGLAAGLKTPVTFQAPVRAIRQDESGVTVKADKGEFSAAYAVIAVPPVLASRIHSDERVGILVGFIDGAHAVEMSAMGNNARREHVVSALVDYFGPKAAEPIAYDDQDWLSEEWSCGCYGAHMAPGVMTHFGDAIREPVGRLHWAGAETATEWAGYMDGALQSGIRAAKEILARDL